jgi:large subunit ribosomal protein L35
MAYKFKPNKSVAKRFKVSKTGKLKHRHTMSTHLRSNRTADKKRELGRSAVLSETQAGNMRKYMGISKLKPAKIAHERKLAEKAEAK